MLTRAALSRVPGISALFGKDLQSRCKARSTPGYQPFLGRDESFPAFGERSNCIRRLQRPERFHLLIHPPHHVGVLRGEVGLLEGILDDAEKEPFPFRVVRRFVGDVGSRETSFQS